MFENGPSDRMQFVGMGGLAHPGDCMVCKNGTCEKGYIRLGVYYDFEGEQYLCWYCLVQAAEILGCLIPDEANSLREVINNLVRENNVMTTELGKANERLAAFDFVLAGISGLPSIDVILASADATQESESHDTVVDSNVEGRTDSESEASESVTEPGRGNISESEPAHSPGGSIPSL